MEVFLYLVFHPRALYRFLRGMRAMWFLSWLLLIPLIAFGWPIYLALVRIDPQQHPILAESMLIDLIILFSIGVGILVMPVILRAVGDNKPDPTKTHA